MSQETKNEYALAELLLRRKELQAAVDRLKPLSQKDLFETRMRRQNVAEGIDEVIAQVSKVSFQSFTHAYDWHARQLRLVDAAIQNANWTTKVSIDAEIMAAYVDPYVKDEAAK